MSGKYPIPVQEYAISVSDSAASTAKQISEHPMNGTQTNVLLIAVGDSIVVKFGGSTVAASKTVTSSKLPASNFTVPVGVPIEYTLGAGDQYVSAIGKTTSTNSTLLVQVFPRGN